MGIGEFGFTKIILFYFVLIQTIYVRLCINTILFLKTGLAKEEQLIQNTADHNIFLSNIDLIKIYYTLRPY